jgi:hypothetical protein
VNNSGQSASDRTSPPGREECADRASRSRSAPCSSNNRCGCCASPRPPRRPDGRRSPRSKRAPPKLSLARRIAVLGENSLRIMPRQQTVQGVFLDCHMRPPSPTAAGSPHQPLCQIDRALTLSANFWPGRLSSSKRIDDRPASKLPSAWGLLLEHSAGAYDVHDAIRGNGAE